MSVELVLAVAIQALLALYLCSCVILAALDERRHAERMLEIEDRLAQETAEYQRRTS